MDYKEKRESGALLHISSLTGRFGIGDFGPGARRFADFLAAAGCSVWQVLPLTPVSAVLGNSPYSSGSAFALNYLFISPEGLTEYGLVSEADCERCEAPSIGSADYDFARNAKGGLLDAAWKNFSTRPDDFARLRDEFNLFCLSERAWLEDYALFYTLREKFGGACWNDWPREYKLRAPAALAAFLDNETKSRRIEYVQFVQFLLRKQWNELREYCASKGVRLIGDVPIYVAYDSADVWAGQECFDLDGEGRPNKVAGVPPDYFSETGQLWGNPVYRWDVLRKTSFRWWISRLRHTFSLFDRARVDHFLGFSRYWAIRADAETAASGDWEIAPGRAFFEALRSELGNAETGELPLIAEDLGVVTEDVHELMDTFGIPGMKVLLFAFSGGGSNPYLPHNYGDNFVVYTGTHDNNTANGWWRNASGAEREAFETYTGIRVQDDRADEALCRLALSSVARTAVLPVQDILGLDEAARMNIPNCAFGCWRWRLTDALMDRLFDRACWLRELNSIYGRLA